MLRRQQVLICCLSFIVSQVFDVETSDMLFEIRTNRMSTVQYCHACPTSNLLAIAFSNYAVEVSHYIFNVSFFFLYKIQNFVCKYVKKILNNTTTNKDK